MRRWLLSSIKGKPMRDRPVTDADRGPREDPCLSG